METTMDDEIKDVSREVFHGLAGIQTETVYENAMEVELILRGYSNIRRQVPHPIEYKGVTVGVGYIDLLVDDEYVIELKVVNNLTLKDEAQVRKYLTKGQTGYLVNFNPVRETAETVKICEI